MQRIVITEQWVPIEWLIGISVLGSHARLKRKVATRELSLIFSHACKGGRTCTLPKNGDWLLLHIPDTAVLWQLVNYIVFAFVLVQHRRYFLNSENQLKWVRRIQKLKRSVVSTETKNDAVKRWAIYKKSCIRSRCWRLEKIEFTLKRFVRAKQTLAMKTMKHCEFENFWSFIYVGHTIEGKGSPISRPILQLKSLYFHKFFYNSEPFVASTGWFDRWKKRY